MPEYDFLVSWNIDINAETPEQAALIAREIQLDPESAAVVFVVVDKKTLKAKTIDLEKI